MDSYHGLPEGPDDGIEGAAERLLETPLSRRKLIAAGAAGAASLALGGAFARNAAAAGTAVPLGAQLRALLDLPTGKAAGAGLEIPLAADFALEGAAASLGTASLTGLRLGLAHVKAAGGPNFKATVRNQGDGSDISKSLSNVREFGADQFSIDITGSGFAQASGIPLYPRYKMMAIDPSGATTINVSKPYAYQAHALYYRDMLAGIIAYWKNTRKSAKSWTIVINDVGASVYKQLQTESEDQLRYVGYKVNPTVLVAYGTTDYSSQIAKLRQQNPDGIFLALFGADVGNFMKQYGQAGMKTPVVGTDWNSDMANIAGSAFANYEFALDSFEGKNPGTQWGKLFAREYLKKFKTVPGIFEANYYETTFLVWQLVRGIIAAGKDPRAKAAGDLYIDAFNKKPSFPSVYGDRGKHGLNVFSANTHSLVRRPMAYSLAGTTGQPKVVATFNLGGRNFKLV